MSRSERPSPALGPPKQAVRLGLPHDSFGFVRRACQACHRAFRTRPAPTDGRLLLKRIAEHVPHGNVDEVDVPSATRFCPYCRHSAREEAWLTDEQRGAVDQWSRAFNVVLNLEQRAVLRAPVTRPANVLASRPAPAMQQAENQALRLVSLPCCGKEMKVEARWPGPTRCHYCGAGQWEQARG